MGAEVEAFELGNRGNALQDMLYILNTIGGTKVEYSKGDVIEFHRYKIIREDTKELQEFVIVQIKKKLKIIK